MRVRLNIVVASVVLAVLGFIWAIPLYALVVGSLKGLAETVGTPLLSPPSAVDLNPLASAFKLLANTMVNTAIVVVPGALLATFLGALAAFAIYLKGGKVSDYLPPLVAITTYIPYQALIVPLISVIKQFEDLTRIPLYDTLHGVLIVFLLYFTPMATLLQFIFMNNLPREIVEAALVDGMRPITVFRKIVLPIHMPGFVATLIFMLINMWNNFFIPLSITRGYEKHITLKIFSYVGQAGTIYNEMFAAALIGSLPPLIIFVILGRYFVRGLLAFTGGGR